MAEAAQLRADRPPGSPDWLLEEGALWPWIGRFLWSPALDLHPSRPPCAVAALAGRSVVGSRGARACVAPSTERACASGRAALGQPRRAISTRPVAGRATCPPCTAHRTRSARPAAGAAGAVLDESERAFLTQRAPLYWRTAHVTGEDPAGTGWAALRILTGNQPDAVKRRFVWKTPITPGLPAPLPDSALLLALTRKILKEFEEAMVVFIRDAAPPRSADPTLRVIPAAQYALWQETNAVIEAAQLEAAAIRAAATEAYEEERRRGYEEGTTAARLEAAEKMIANVGSTIDYFERSRTV